jgi:hypothetical protein
MSELYFSVDVEATGPVPGEYSMASIGIVVVGKPELFFYCELEPISPAYDSGALAVCGFTMEQLFTTGWPPDLTMEACDAWVKKVAGTDRAVFVSQGMFDWQFVNYYFHRFLNRNPFGINGIDMKSYFMGMDSCKWRDAAKRRMRRRTGVKLPHTHNALDDAREQAAIFGQLLHLNAEPVPSLQSRPTDPCDGPLRACHD